MIFKCNNIIVIKYTAFPFILLSNYKKEFKGKFKNVTSRISYYIVGTIDPAKYIFYSFLKV